MRIIHGVTSHEVRSAFHDSLSLFCASEEPAGRALGVGLSSEAARGSHDGISKGDGGRMLNAGRFGGKPEPGHMAHGRQVVAAVMKEGKSPPLHANLVPLFNRAA